MRPKKVVANVSLSKMFFQPSVPQIESQFSRELLRDVSIPVFPAQLPALVPALEPAPIRAQAPRIYRSQDEPVPQFYVPCSRKERVLTDENLKNHSAGQEKRHKEKRKREEDDLKAGKNINMADLIASNNATWDGPIKELKDVRDLLIAQSLIDFNDPDFLSLEDVYKEKYPETGGDLFLKMKEKMEAKSLSFDANLLMIDNVFTVFEANKVEALANLVLEANKRYRGLLTSHIFLFEI